RDFFGGHSHALAGPAFALHRQALDYGRALRQYAVEAGIVQIGWKIQRRVVKRIAGDQAGQRRERQVAAIDRMGEQQRVALRRLDSPERVELDDEAIVLEER